MKAAVKLVHMSSEDITGLLAFQLKAHHAPQFDREFRICPERKFHIDIYFAKERLAVEVDGGGYINGRHSRGYGMDSDAEKSALIARLPARLLRVTPRWVKNGHAVQWILTALNTKL